MLSDFIYLALHLDSVTVIVAETRIVLRVSIRFLNHRVVLLFSRCIDQALANFEL